MNVAKNQSINQSIKTQQKWRHTSHSLGILFCAMHFAISSNCSLNNTFPLIASHNSVKDDVTTNNKSSKRFCSCWSVTAIEGDMVTGVDLNSVVPQSITKILLFFYFFPSNGGRYQGYLAGLKSCRPNDGLKWVLFYW